LTNIYIHKPKEFLDGITLPEVLEIYETLIINLHIEAKLKYEDGLYDWYVNRFKIQHGLSKKEYSDILIDTKKYINRHKELLRKDTHNDLARNSLEGYIEKEKKIKNRILNFGKKNKEVLSIEDAKIVPITNFIEFNTYGFTKCIFHSEKTGSMKYDKEKNKVYCFGSCQKYYDVIDVVQKQYSKDFINAIKFLNNSI